MKNIYFTYFASDKKNILGINRALVAKKYALCINRALVAKKNLASFCVICLTLLCGFCGSVHAQSSVLFSENFEGGSMPSGWTKDGSGTWSVGTGDNSSSTGAGEGSKNAKITHGTSGVKTKLITPVINLSSVTTSAELSFMHVQRSWAGDIDALRVYYRTSTSGSWTLIAGQTYTSAVPSWTTREGIVLPGSGGCSTYQIAFEMEDKYGYGVGIDMVKVIKPATCAKPGTPSASDIDDESATITWTAGGTEGSWNFRYKASSAAVWTTINGLTNRTYDLSGLSANTLYNVEVQADCGGGDLSDWKAGTFQTACRIIRSLPWNSDADFAATTTNYDIPKCWERATTAYYSNPGMMSSGAYLQFQGNNNMYYYTTAMSVIVLPKFAVDIKNLKVTVTYSTTSNGDAYPQFYLGYIEESDVSDATKFHSLQTLPKTSSITTYTTSTPFTMSGATSGSRVAIKFNNTTTTSTSTMTQRNGRIKKITVEMVSTPTCPNPTSLAVPAANITSNSAIVTWTKGDATASILEYKLHDAGAWTVASSSATSPYNLTGLSANSQYDVRVKNTCDGDSESNYVSTSFNTPCGETSLPYGVYGFEDVAIGDGISNIPNCWDRQGYTSLGYTYPFVYTAEPKSGSNSLYFRGGTSSSTQSIILPEFTEDIENLTVSFYYKGSVDGKDSWGDTKDYGNLEVGYVSGGSFTRVGSVLPQLSTYAGSPVEVPIIGPEIPSDARIAIRYAGGMHTGLAYIDDIRVFETPVFTCYTPTGLTASASSATSANLSWTKGGDETAWKVRYSTDGETWTVANSGSSLSSPSVTVAGSSVSYTLTGLEENTTYYIQVQADCGSSQSGWTPSAEVTTPCTAQTAIGWSEDFESVAAGYIPAMEPPVLYHNMPECWKKIDYNNYPYVFNRYARGESENCLYFCGGTSSTTQIAVLPEFTEDINTLTLSLYYQNAITYGDYTGASYGSLEVGYITNPANAATFTRVGSALPKLSSYGTNATEVPISGAPSGAYIALRYTGGTERGYVCVDDISISLSPTCFEPGGLTRTGLTYNSASFSWTASGQGETTYQWAVAEGNAAPVWVDDAAHKVNTTSATVTGLTTGTTYKFYVRSYCDASDQSEAVSSSAFTPTCPTITGIILTNMTVTGVTVNWTLSGGNVPCSVRYRSALEILTWHTAVSDTEETSCDISGLSPDITYHIQVKTACGDWVDADDYIPRILPPTPTITAYDGSVKVTWGGVFLASGYQYIVVPRDAAHSWSSAVSVATNPTDANPLIISGLSAGTAYDLYVRTSYLLVHSLERKEPFATITMPPTGLSNTAVTTTTASFTWTIDANSSATQFQWACKPGSATPSAGDWSEPLGTDVRNCTVTELEDGTNYTFYVRTYYGEGVYSSAVSLAFTTECGIKQLDYIENFEGGNPVCWTTTLDEWSTLGNRWAVVDDEGHQMRFNAKTNVVATNYLIMPQVYLFTEAELSFRIKNVYYPASSPEYIEGYVIVSDGETERQIRLMDASSFTKQTIDLAEFAGKTVTIKFYSPAKLAHTAFLELDDVAVKAVATWIFTNNTGDGLWTTKGNWDKGIKEDRIPTITDDVSIRKPATVNDEHATAKSIVIDHSNGNTGKITIQALKGLEVSGTIQLNTGSSLTSTTPADLILESSEGGNASLIFNNSNADQARVGFYSKGFIDGEGVKNYQYIGIPFTEVNALYNYYGSWIYSWSDKGSGYGWKKVPNGGIVNAWTGYCITQEAPTTYAIEGTLVPTTSQDITVPANENMVVGNSWTAPIDINAFEDGDFENLDGNVYFFNTGVDKTGEGGTAKTRYAGSTYVTVPIHSALYTGDDHIASMQGFFVKNTSGSAGTLHLNYAKHVRGTTRESIIGDALHAPKRGEATEMDEPVVLKITVSGDNYDDKLVLLAREDFSNGFDNGWDGDKWDGNESAQYIYSPDSEGTENSVSAVPELEGTVIGFRAGEDDEYTMYFDYLNGDEKLYLWDTETGDYTVIKTGYAYAFTTADKEKHARFIITRSNGQDVSTGLTSTASQGEGAKAKKLLIENKMYIMVDGMLFDATGKEIR